MRGVDWRPYTKPESPSDKLAGNDSPLALAMVVPVRRALDSLFAPRAADLLSHLAKRYPHWGVIAGPLLSSDNTVHARLFQPRRQ